MGTMLEYLDWRGDLKFENDPFNDIDNQLCAQLSFIGYKGLVPERPGEEVGLPEATAAFFDIHRGKELSLGAIIPADIFSMAEKMAVSPRFGKTRLTAYKNVLKENTESGSEVQWTALTMLFEDNTMYISFSGTDDTLVSWKEDMNMAFAGTVPSQIEATDYVNAVIEAYPGYRVRIGGHSKGGNLAVYSAAKCRENLQERISVVYDNDGPGFSQGFLREPGYLRIREKVRNILPEESVVGLLLCHDFEPIVVKSTQKSIMQHDSFSWIVEQNRFVRADGLSERALLFEKAVKGWLDGMSEEERMGFVDALYRLLTFSNAKTLSDLAGDKAKLLKSFGNMEASDRALVHGALRELLDQGKEVIPAVLEEKRILRRERKKLESDFVTHVDGAALYEKKKVLPRKISKYKMK